VNPDNVVLSHRGKKIKIDSLNYYKAALTSRVWITNTAIERGLNLKGKNTLYLCTWHGSTLKKLWHDLTEHGSDTFVPKSKVSFDFLCAQSDYDIDVFSKAFRIDQSKIIKSGLPRNDILTQPNQELRNKVRTELHVSDDKILILYVPTYRDYQLERPFFHPDYWDMVLKEDYTVLYRFHHLESQSSPRFSSSRIIDVSTYPDIQHLMMASDLMISDYSSIFFDYSILNKPMFCYAPDLEKYKQERGLYIEPKQLLSQDKVFYDEESLLKVINKGKLLVEDMDQTEQEDRKKYLQVSGTATKICTQLVADNLF